MKPMSKDLVRKSYNKIAKRYMAVRDQFTNDRYLMMLNNLLEPNSKILDLGCGAGKPVDKFFIYHGHRVTGIDFSEKQIKLAKRNTPRARYEIKDIASLRKEEYQVDAVVSFYTILHLPRETHRELFDKINSFLPEGGLALVTMGSSEWEGIEDFYGVDMYFSHYAPEKNRAIIETAGFKVLLDEIDTSGGERHQVILARKLGE
jgi:cyclopropane fatty-acyl-phospholipid synthase-like methyltransferase